MTLSERKHKTRKLLEQVERGLAGAPTSEEWETLQEDLIEAANHVKAIAIEVRKLEKAEDDCLSDGTPLYPRRKPTREEKLHSKIAIKFHVVYNATFHEFRGDTDNVRKATAALEKWAHAERASYRRQDL